MATRPPYDDDDDDEYDSDDSGFDTGLSTDELLLGRIAKMRNMMTLTTDEPSPADKTPVPAAAAAAEGPAPLEKEPASVKPAATDHEDDEFLLVDRVQTLALSPQARQAQAEELVGMASATEPVEGIAEPPRDQHVDDNEREVGAKDVDVDGDDDDDEEDDGYIVAWTHGQLGLQFKAGPHGETLIRRINKKTSSAEGLHLARVGDVLVAINGVTTSGRAFQDLVEQLRLPDFPVMLSFQPLTLSDEDDEDDNGLGDHIVRSSDQEMQRKESSLSAISSNSSNTNGGYAPQSTPTGPMPRPASFGSTAAHRLNQFGSSHAVPPPPYGGQPYSRSQTLDDSPGPGEYDVVWRQGSLGCGVKQRNGLPMIKSVKPGAAVDPSVQQIAPGDVMILINGMDTDAIGFRAVVETMQRAPKPLYMRFRRADHTAYQVPPPKPHGNPLPRPSSRYENNDIEKLRDSRVDMEDILAGSLNPSQYTVLWNEGPLGVQIKPRPSDGTIVVTKFTGTGNPELLSSISIGDVFVRIAGYDVSDMGIAGTYEKLKTVHKPVVLVFERSTPPHQAPREPTSTTPAPPPAVRQGFAAEDLQDSTTVPSFRELREREAAANGGRHGGSFGGFNPEERGETVFGATGRRAQIALQRPASYDTLDDHHDAGLRSRHSFPQTDHSSGDGRYQDRASEPSHPSGERSGGGVDIGADGTDFLPRFSDIEKGRVKTTAVAALPPPPAYHDTFTPSGRFLDPNQFADAPQPPLSPHSDDRRGGNWSSGQERQQGPPPAYAGGHGYTPPNPPGGGRNPMEYSRPMPPSYDHYGGHYNARGSGAGGGGYDGSQRIDILRQQYIESERMRNQLPPQAREGAMTEISTYSDLDDSGIMAAMRRPADRMRMQASPNYGPASRQPLPTPELWIKWSEGPLGITFRRTNGQIVVSRLTGQGYSRGLEQLRAGDWLVSFGNPSVGTYATSELRLAETMDLIKKLPKPVDMRFIVR